MKLLLERRDKLRTDLEAIKARLDEVETMLRLLRGEVAPAAGVDHPPGARQKRGSIKQVVIDVISEAGEAGLSSAECIDAAREKRSMILDRASVASLLSRFKKDDILIFDGTRYRMKQYAGPREAA
jgi:hypothetical protein